MTKPALPSLETFLTNVVSYLHNGGTRSVVVLTNGATCAYRGDNDAKCFVGVTISDEVASAMEGYSADALHKCYSLLEEDPNVHALCELQRIHDNSCNWTNGKFNDRGWDELKEWAAAYDLEDTYDTLTSGS